MEPYVMTPSQVLEPKLIEDGNFVAIYPVDITPSLLSCTALDATVICYGCSSTQQNPNLSLLYPVISFGECTAVVAEPIPPMGCKQHDDISLHR